MYFDPSSLVPSSVDPPEFELMTYTPVGVRLPEPPRGLPLRLEVKEKDQNTGTPEPYFGKTLFQGFAVFDGQDFIPFGSFHRLPIFWDGRLNAFGHKDVTARYALWEDEE